jgi:hypothetical protein
MVLAQKQNKHIVHWNRTEDPEINPHSNRHLMLCKGDKIFHWRKDSLFT